MSFRPIEQLPGASTRARARVEEIEESADRHMAYRLRVLRVKGHAHWMMVQA